MPEIVEIYTKSKSVTKSPAGLFFIFGKEGFMESRYKEVDYYEYCQKCKHKDKKEEEQPCFECLEEPVNLYSRRPVKFEEAEKRVQK